MSEQIKFDCGNRTDDCNNATICPCLLFMSKTMESYDKLIQSDIFREATKEEHDNVRNYVKEHSIPTGINFNDLIN